MVQSTARIFFVMILGICHKYLTSLLGGQDACMFYSGVLYFCCMALRIDRVESLAKTAFRPCSSIAGSPR